MLISTAKWLPTVSLAACSHDATMGIGLLADGPIKAPKDLESWQMASTVTSSRSDAHQHRAGWSGPAGYAETIDLVMHYLMDLGAKRPDGDVRRPDQAEPGRNGPASIGASPNSTSI